MGPPLGMERVWEKLTRWGLDTVVARGLWALGMTFRTLLPNQCCLWLTFAPAFLVGSQDSPEALVPEQKVLLDPQVGTGKTLCMTLPTSRTSYLEGHCVHASFLLRLALHMTLRQGTSPLSFSFLICEMGINAT